MMEGERESCPVKDKLVHCPSKKKKNAEKGDGGFGQEREKRGGMAGAGPGGGGV